MKKFYFRIDGLTEEKIQQWKKQSQSTVRTFGTLVLITIAFIAVYRIDQHSTNQFTEVQKVVQTVPPQGSNGIPTCTPSIFFLNEPYRGSIDYSTHVVDAEGRSRNFTGDSFLCVLKSKKGNPIVILSPNQHYPRNATVVTEIRQKSLTILFL